MFTAIKAFLAFCWALVIQYIKGSSSNELALRQRDEELRIARARLDTLEAAAVKDRDERLKKVDEKAASVSSRADADELLRAVTADDPDLN